MKPKIDYKDLIITTTLQAITYGGRNLKVSSWYAPLVGQGPP